MCKMLGVLVSGGGFTCDATAILSKASKLLRKASAVGWAPLAGCFTRPTLSNLDCTPSGGEMLNFRVRVSPVSGRVIVTSYWPGRRGSVRMNPRTEPWMTPSDARTVPICLPWYFHVAVAHAAGWGSARLNTTVMKSVGLKTVVSVKDEGLRLGLS